MTEKLEFDLTVKGGKNNDLSSAITDATKKAFDLEGALKTAIGVFGGNIFTKGFDAASESLKKAVSESIDFKRAQLEIETILPANVKLTKQLVDQLEDLSNQYGTSATTQAKAYYEIISAGVSDAADGAKLLARANELATGGVTDTASTIDLLTTIYNVYGKEVATAAEASDSLFKTVQLGKTTIAELSADLGQALPIAKSFGIGLDEVGAVLAQLTNSGISTSESVTLLNAVLSAIAKNGDKLGVGCNSTAVQTEGLGVVLERLKERTKGSNDALFDLLGRQEAVRAVQALTSRGLENYNATLAEYSNKAGVAAEASKKIIEGDLGKQFDILGSKIANTARSFVDLFIPATLAATTAINNFFSDAVITDQDEINRGLQVNRVRIEQLEILYKSGKISVDAYKTSLANLNAEINFLSNSADSATSPLVTIAAGLEKDAERIKAQIGSLKNGFDELQLGPLERDLKVSELNTKLADTIKKIAEMKKVVAETVPVPPVIKSADAIANEGKTLEDIRALRAQFAIEEQATNANLLIQNQEDQFARREFEIQNIYDTETAKLTALTEAELAKTAFLKTEDEKRLAAQKINEDASLKQLKLASQKVIAEKQNESASKKKSDDDYKANLGTTLDQISSLQSSGNKTLVAIGKAAALSQLAISGPVAFGKALELGPIIGPPLAAAVAASFAAQAARVAGVQFEQGGIVGQTGATPGPDNRVATIRDGEMILNANQQKNLMDMINSGSGGGDIVIQINEREIARAVRSQVQQGFRLA